MTGHLLRGAARLAATTLLVLGAAACSDDGESIDADADEEVIDDAILTADDLPDGFEEQDPDDDDDDGGGEEALDECAEEGGIDADEIDDNKVVDSDDSAVEFSLEDDVDFVQVNASIGSVRDPGLNEDALELFEDDDFQDCVFDELEQLFSDGNELDDFEAEVIDAGADGDASAAIRIDAEISGIDAALEQHFVLVGRFGITLQVLSLGSSIDDELVEDALDEMIERIEDATDD